MGVVSSESSKFPIARTTQCTWCSTDSILPSFSLIRIYRFSSINSRNTAALSGFERSPNETIPQLRAFFQCTRAVRLFGGRSTTDTTRCVVPVPVMHELLCIHATRAARVVCSTGDGRSPPSPAIDLAYTAREREELFSP